MSERLVFHDLTLRHDLFLALLSIRLAKRKTCTRNAGISSTAAATAEDAGLLLEVEAVTAASVYTRRIRSDALMLLLLRTATRDRMPGTMDEERDSSSLVSTPTTGLTAGTPPLLRILSSLLLLFNPDAKGMREDFFLPLVPAVTVGVWVAGDEWHLRSPGEE